MKLCFPNLKSLLWDICLVQLPLGFCGSISVLILCWYSLLFICSAHGWCKLWTWYVKYRKFPSMGYEVPFEFFHSAFMMRPVKDRAMIHIFLHHALFYSVLDRLLWLEAGCSTFWSFKFCNVLFEKLSALPNFGFICFCPSWPLQISVVPWTIFQHFSW